MHYAYLEHKHFTRRGSFIWRTAPFCLIESVFVLYCLPWLSSDPLRGNFVVGSNREMSHFAACEKVRWKVEESGDEDKGL